MNCWLEVSKDVLVIIVVVVFRNKEFILLQEGGKLLAHPSPNAETCEHSGCHLEQAQSEMESKLITMPLHGDVQSDLVSLLGSSRMAPDKRVVAALEDEVEKEQARGKLGQLVCLMMPLVKRLTPRKAIFFPGLSCPLSKGQLFCIEARPGQQQESSVCTTLHTGHSWIDKVNGKIICFSLATLQRDRVVLSLDCIYE